MPIWQYKAEQPTFVGCVIKTAPNQYAGFDFYNDKALVWDHEARAPKWITYSCGHQGGAESGGSAKVDATQAVLDAYTAFEAKRLAAEQYANRKKYLLDKRKTQSEKFALARELEVPYARIKRLEYVTPAGLWGQTVKLLKAKKLKSAFRISLRQQVISWLTTAEPEYRSPLSAKQWGYV